MLLVARDDEALLIIDIGACVGVFIDDCLRRYDVAKVYAFEPLPANYEFLRKKYSKDGRVKLFRQAVADFAGEARLYKKPYVRRLLGIPYKAEFDFAGNAGSSIKKKSNVSLAAFERVEVVSLSDFILQQELSWVDILKIDSEGSEYDILHDLLNANLVDRIGKIFFEDHVRKVPEIIGSQRRFVERIRGTSLERKFYVQDVVTGNDLAYIPLQEAYRREFFGLV